MTITVGPDTPTATDPNCQSPNKLRFDTETDALATAAAKDAEYGVSTHAVYECTDHWHLTTHPEISPKPLRTSSKRIDAAAVTFPKAPLRPSTDLGAGFVVVSPKVAAYWLLEFNTHNRGIRGAGVSALAVDIMTGGWDLNGESVKFSADLAILDGQHRLKAVVAAGSPVPLLLVTGLEPLSQDTIDVGIKRSFADILKLAGETDCVNLATVTAAVARWKTDQIRGAKISLSVPVLKRVFRDHPEIRDATVAIRQVHKRIGPVRNSVVGLSWWLFAGINPGDARFFFDQLCAGTGMGANDPIWRLREVLLKNAAAKRKLSAAEMLALWIKAWNFYRLGQEVRLLAWKSGGEHPEAFPIPR